MKAFLGFCVLLASVAAQAQLGETLVKMEETYGKGAKAKSKLVLPPFTKVYFFTRRQLKIKVGFIDDICVYQALRPEGRTAKMLARSSVEAALADNAVETEDTDKWTEAERKLIDPLAKSKPKLRKAWIRSDSKAWAHLTSLELTIFNQTYLDHAKKAKEAAEKKKRFRKLVAVVKGKDFDKSLVAIRDISKLGPDYVTQLPELVTELQKKNRQKITNALGRLPKRNTDQEEALAKLRTTALANIPKLSKEDKKTIADAHKYYKDLMRQSGLMAAKLAKRAEAVLALKELLERDQRLLNILEQLSKVGGDAVDTKSEKEFAETVETSLGGTVIELIAMPGPESRPPKNPALQAIWLYDFNRKMEAYNKSRLKDRAATDAEYKNLYILNEYREALGLRRLELDERLVQSGRKHSKEMVDLKYFAHVSPTPENATFSKRIAKTGYPKPGGENIAYGRGEAEQVFWMWFDSPGHHQNMTRAGYKALGVGKWATHWTQNFGSANLLLFADQKTKDAAKPKEKILNP